MNIPGVNVNVGATVVVNSNATAIAVSNASGSAGAGSVFYGGGGGSYYVDSGSSGLVQGLNVETGPARRAIEETRKIVRIVVIQAVCMDDQTIPHPASQVFPGRDVAEGYEGELFRCIAGTHMQYVIKNLEARADCMVGPGGPDAMHGPMGGMGGPAGPRGPMACGEGGETLNCAKGEALNYGPSATGPVLACRPQKAARDCNERSLLRRFGAGEKVLKLVTIETYRAYREETVTSASAMNMTIDGGVGGFVH